MKNATAYLKAYISDRMDYLNASIYQLNVNLYINNTASFFIAHNYREIIFIK